MSVFLLVLGVLTTVAGLALVASGLTIHDGAFDTEVITPGTIAAIGGMLLIGMGLAVRELRRIERALAARPATRPARLGEAPTAASAESPDSAVPLPVPPSLPFPPPLKAGPSLPPPPPGASTAPAVEDAAIERLRAKVPTLAPAESGAAVAKGEASSPPRAPLRAAEDLSEAKDPAKDATSASRPANGAAPARLAPRLDSRSRPPASPVRAKGSVINAFWPAGPRRSAQTASAQAPVPVPLLPIEPASGSEPVGDAGAPVAEPAAAAEVSILKSGVVEGIAYTLYSDGSIVAQLPKGRLRFGSIAALLDHVESGA